MKFELFIAQRLSFKGDKTKSTSPSINIAVAGIAMAIVIMTVAIVVVLGFKHEIRQKVMGFDAQITILPLSNTSSITQSNYINFNDTLKSIVSTILPDAEFSLSIKNPCILKTDDNFLGIILKGMDSNHDWSFVNSNITLLSYCYCKFPLKNTKCKMHLYCVQLFYILLTIKS